MFIALTSPPSHWSPSSHSPAPAPFVSQELLALGAKLTISDDSHKPEQIAVCYPQLHTRLLDAGVDVLHRLHHTKAEGIVAMEAVPRSAWETHAAWWPAQAAEK